MTTKCTNHKLLWNITVGYVITVLLYQVLYLLIPFQVFISKSVLQYLSPALAMVGFGLLGLNLILDRQFLEIRHCWLQLGMLVCLTISALVNYRYGFVNNVKGLIWQSVQMLLITTVISRQCELNWKRIVKALFLLLSVVLFVSNMISFYQYFHMIGYNVHVNSYEIRQGLLEGRLFGIYNNPYDSSLISSIMTLAAIYYLSQGKNIRTKIAYALIALESFVMTALTGSRSAVVALAGTVFLFTLCVVLHRSTLKKISDTAYKVLVGIVAGVAALGVVIGAFSLTHRICKGIAAEVQSSMNQNGEIILPSEKDDAMIEPGMELEEQYDREDVNASNISNNRFEIWHDYFEVMRQNPHVAIIGASAGGYMPYIFANHPDLYIVSHMVKCYPNMIAHSRIYDTHNGYISAMISGGLITMVLLVVFLVSLTVKGLKSLYRQKTMSAELLLELSILSFLLIDAFFATDLFFKCTIGSVLFWINYGFMVRNIRNTAEA